jgi:hypothetical protein
MKHFLIPHLVQKKSFPDLDHAQWSDASEFSLGGCFYDHLCAPNGDVVGVRYWVDAAVNFTQHPVFSGFSSDKRFKFNQNRHYVDIVFDDANATALKNGGLNVHTVQDFGGENVIKFEEKFGIVFSF